MEGITIIIEYDLHSLIEVVSLKSKRMEFINGRGEKGNVFD